MRCVVVDARCVVSCCFVFEFLSCLCWRCAFDVCVCFVLIMFGSVWFGFVCCVCGELCVV